MLHVHMSTNKEISCHLIQQIYAVGKSCPLNALAVQGKLNDAAVWRALESRLRIFHGNGRTVTVQRPATFGAQVSPDSGMWTKQPQMPAEAVFLLQACLI